MKNLSSLMLAGCVIAFTVETKMAIAQSSNSTIYLDYSNVIASRQSIILNRLPIKLPTGAVIYKDVTIQLVGDASGVVSISPSIPTQTLSPPVLSAKFRAGTYLLPTTTTGFGLTGPSPIPGSVMTKWEVNNIVGKAYACGAPAVFYVGPLSSHPYSARLKAAGITSTEYSYGIIGSPYNCGSFHWVTGYIVGFAQAGAMLSIASFTDTSGDHNLPLETYTYQLQ